MYEVKLNLALLANRTHNTPMRDQELRELLQPDTLSDSIVGGLQPYALQSIGKAQFEQLATKFDQARIDKLVGSPSSAAGSTNLISLPGSSSLVSFAINSGGLTQTINGNTATLRTNLDGVISKLDGLPPNCTGGCKGWRGVAKSIDFSAAFNLSSSGSTSIPTSGAANSSTPSVSNVNVPSSAMKLSSFSARYTLYNPLDPRSKQFHDAFLGVSGNDGLFAQHKVDYEKGAAALDKVLGSISNSGYLNDPAFTALRGKYAGILGSDIDKQDAAALKRDFSAYFAANLQLIAAHDPTLVGDIGTAQLALTSYAELNDDIVSVAKGKPEVTVEYTLSKPTGQPETHDLRFITALTPQGAGGVFTGASFTFNAAASLYNNVSPNASYSRLKDVQLALQFDRPILGNLATKKATVTVAGYGQYQSKPSVLDISAGNLAPGTNITLPSNAQVLLGTAGWLGVMQVKFTITMASGAAIPVGFKWANKTDLLDSNKINGQFGISYDFSNFSQLFGQQ